MRQQGPKHLSNKDKTRYLELQSSKTQRPRCQYKNKFNNSLDTLPPLEPRNRITAGSEHCNIAESQNKYLKTAFMNMTEVLREEMNKDLEETYENMK